MTEEEWGNELMKIAEQIFDVSSSDDTPERKRELILALMSMVADINTAYAHTIRRANAG